MTLDSFADPARAPHSYALNKLMQPLLHALGPDWEWDNTHANGVRIRNPQLTLRLVDKGHGMLEVEAVMPDEFMPAPGFKRNFSAGAQQIAERIANETIPEYLEIVGERLHHEQEEQRWQHYMTELLTQIGEYLDIEAQIEVSSEPSTNLSVLFKNLIGDSMRIDAFPGVGPCLTIHVPWPEQLWALVLAWKEMPRGAWSELQDLKPEPAQTAK